METSQTSQTSQTQTQTHHLNRGGGKKNAGKASQPTPKRKGILKKKEVGFKETPDSPVNSAKDPATQTTVESAATKSQQSSKTSNRSVRHYAIKVAKDVRQVFQTLGLPDLPAPVVNQPMLNSLYGSVVPFYTAHSQEYIYPYPLASLGAFAASDEYSFIQYDFKQARKVYSDHPDQLAATIKNQWNQVFSENLSSSYRVSLKQVRGEKQDYLWKVSILGTVFESTQMACANDIKWTLQKKIFFKQDKPQEVLLKVIPVPVTNQSRRNVLDSEAKHLLGVAEFNEIMNALSQPSYENKVKTFKYSFDLFEFFREAHNQNINLTEYSQQSLGDLSGAAEKFSSRVKYWRQKQPDTLVSASSVESKDGSEEDDADSAATSRERNPIGNREKALCSYLSANNKISEPTTAINCFFKFDTVYDYLKKHVNPSQLVGQQLLRNPVGILTNPMRVYASVQNPLQGDLKNFVDNTLFLAGSYEDSTKNSSTPKVNSLTARVTLRMIAVLKTRNVGYTIDDYLSQVTQKDSHNSLRQDALLELLKQLLETFCAEAQSSGLKGNLLEHYNPIIAVSVWGESKEYYMTTNVKLFDGQLLIRRPRKKDLFKSEYFNKARRDKAHPTLFDVAAHVSKDADWNLTGDYIHLSSLTCCIKRDRNITQQQLRCPFYQFLLLFLQCCDENGVKFGSTKHISIQEIAVFVLVKDTQVSLAGLMHELSLVDISGGDFAQHTGVATQRQSEQVKQNFKKAISGERVEMDANFLQHAKHFTDASHKNVLNWYCLSSDLISKSPNDLIAFFKDLKQEQSATLKKFTQNVITKLSQNSKAKLSNVLLVGSFEELTTAQSFEQAMIAVALVKFYQAWLKPTQFVEFGTTLVNMIEFYQTTELIPFFVLCQKQQPDQAYLGLVPTAHMIGFDRSEFTNFMRKQNEDFEEHVLILSDGVIPKPSLQLLINRFHKTLLSLLKFYLETHGKFTIDQLRLTLSNQNVQSNFAFLIGSGIDEECSAEPKIRQQYVQDVMEEDNSIFNDLEAPIEEYGNILRGELIYFLGKLRVASIKWPTQLREFAQKHGIDAGSKYKIPQKASQDIDQLAFLIDRDSERKREEKAKTKSALANELYSKIYEADKPTNRECHTSGNKRLYHQAYNLPVLTTEKKPRPSSNSKSKKQTGKQSQANRSSKSQESATSKTKTKAEQKGKAKVRPKSQDSSTTSAKVPTKRTKKSSKITHK